ncbi:MAG: hypothetical protein Q8P18_09830 [Pseudomonadota bacterium]|nr:hypothetical protein [Pseudomonadota bacterium]
MLLLLPLAAQAAVMAVDEGWFHRRRGLPRWERLGHPLDTLTVLLTYVWALTTDPDRPGAIGVYTALAVFSCLFITKDEFVHARVCSALECWLHALLFVLHPIVLWAFYVLWQSGGHSELLRAQAALTLLAGTYQLIYWSVWWKPEIADP